MKDQESNPRPQERSDPRCGVQEAIMGLDLDANYSQGPGSLKGKLSVRIGGEEVALDLAQVADRLLAIEVASTWRTTLVAVVHK